MLESTEEVRRAYADIIDLPHWDPSSRSRASLHDRAVQFAPYAALVGYGDMVSEEGRLTDAWIDPGEEDAEDLERSLALLAEILESGKEPSCSITWFVPDEKKAGGEIVTAKETVRRIEPDRRKIILARRRPGSGSYEEIDFDRLIRIRMMDPAEMAE